MPTEREKLAYELEGLSLQEAADYILANYDPKIRISNSPYPTAGFQVARNFVPTVLGDGELRFQIMDYLDEHDDECASDLSAGIMQLFASQAPKLDDSELREQLWHILGGKPKPEGFWQEFLYAAAREYEGDARRYKQLEKLEQLFASHSAAAFERGRIAEAKVCEKAKRHDTAAAQGQAAGCPCNYIEPCSQACSCANPVMSGGCQRCCKYGSLEQRREAARQLAGCLTPAAQERAVAQGMRRARDIVLRRTEIPKDAKNPTRDYVVILGEEIAELIERELTAQPEKQQGENHGS